MPYLRASLCRRGLYAVLDKLHIFFRAPREMTVDEIKRVVSRFTVTAEPPSDVGFAVIENKRRLRIRPDPLPVGEDK